MRRKLVPVGVAGACLTVAALASVAWPAIAGAQDEAPTIQAVADTLKATSESTNLLWVVIGAALVIFMQAGFAMVETGFCRAKNAAHVVS